VYQPAAVASAMKPVLAATALAKVHIALSATSHLDAQAGCLLQQAFATNILPYLLLQPTLQLAVAWTRFPPVFLSEVFPIAPAAPSVPFCGAAFWLRMSLLLPLSDQAPPCVLQEPKTLICEQHL
jgi:hypothetical protein